MAVEDVETGTLWSSPHAEFGLIVALPVTAKLITDGMDVGRLEANAGNSMAPLIGTNIAVDVIVG